MKTIRIFKSICLVVSLIMVLLAGTQVAAQNTVAFTQADREILIRLEGKMESFQKQLELTNQRIDDLKSDVNDFKSDVNSKFSEQKSEFDRRFGEVMTFMYWGFGILFTMMMVLMGFVLWDRRTAIAPLEIRQRRMEEAMIEFAKIDPKFKEILKKAALY